MTDDIGNLDDKVRYAANRHPQAQVVAQENDVLDAGLKSIGVHLRLRRQTHSLRTDGENDGVPRLARRDLESLNDLAVDFHARYILLYAEDATAQHVVFADEAGNERTLRLLVQRFGQGDLLNTAAAKDGHAVGHDHRLLLVVGNIQDGNPQGALDTPDFILHFFPQATVEGAEGLVDQHQAGLEHQRPGNRHPLLLTSGQLVRPAVFKPLQAYELQRPLDTLAALPRIEPAHLKREGQIAANRHVGKKRVVLKDDADAPLAGRQIVHRAAPDADAARGGRLEAGQHHEAGRLAGAGSAQEGQEFPLVNAQVQVTHDLDTSVIALADALELDVGTPG